MDATYWQRQTADEPLFPDLLWDRPENRLLAGKLLVVGGNSHGFAVPAEAYQHSLTAGVGVAKVLLPDAIQKIIGAFLETAEFAPSTPVGSFGKKSLAELMDLANWADMTLIAGELGRNSETAVVLEEFVKKSPVRLAITRDAVDYFTSIPLTLLERSDTLIVLSLAQLQKLCTSAHFTQPITFAMDLLRLVDALHNLTTLYPAHIIVKHLDTIFVASGGQVSTTKLPEDKEIWRVETAAHASVWWLQNLTKPFEALTTAVHESTTKNSI